jgi:hypothetical protein
LPFTIFFKNKSNLNSKEELWEFKYFTMQKYNLQQKKNPPKETQILHDIIHNSTTTNLKFHQHKAKYHLSKILI